MYAVVQRGEARTAETAQLAQRLGAQALVEKDLDRSLLLARQAVAIDDTPQTRGYLLAALVGSPRRDRDHARRRRRLRGSCASPDGKTLAVAGVGGAGIRFFDARTYEQIGRPLNVPTGPFGLKDVVGLAYSPDGERLAVITFPDFGIPGYLRVIDVRTREVLAEATGFAFDVVFTRDGSSIVLTEYVGYGGIRSSSGT